MTAAFALGTAQLGLDYGVANRRGRPDDADAASLIARAIERGVTWFDTAPAYGDAEARLGRWLPGDARVVTKLPALPDALPDEAIPGWVQASVDASRGRLKRDLDVLLLHRPPPGGARGQALRDALDGALGVGRWGASIYDVDELADYGAIQVPCNVLDRRFLGLSLPGLRFARSALLQGLLTMRRSPRVPAASPWLERLHEAGLTVPRALGWCALRSGADAIVVGVDGIDQLDACLDGWGQADGLDALDAIGQAPLDVVDPRRWG